jgi:hypothetical protein
VSSADAGVKSLRLYAGDAGDYANLVTTVRIEAGQDFVLDFYAASKYAGSGQVRLAVYENTTGGALLYDSATPLPTQPTWTHVQISTTATADIDSFCFVNVNSGHLNVDSLFLMADLGTNYTPNNMASTDTAKGRELAQEYFWSTPMGDHADFVYQGSTAIRGVVPIGDVTLTLPCVVPAGSTMTVKFFHYESSTYWVKFRVYANNSTTGQLLLTGNTTVGSNTWIEYNFSEILAADTQILVFQTYEKASFGHLWVDAMSVTVE